MRGPSAAEGYWNQREKSRRTFEGDWTRTGDNYMRDAEGYYIYCGRTDDMFKVSGIWVSPFEVESALIAASGRARSRGRAGRRTTEASQAEGLRGAARRQQATTASRGAEGAREASDRPVEISALDRRRGRLPKTATGKIQRFKLREGAPHVTQPSSPALP